MLDFSFSRPPLRQMMPLVVVGLWGSAIFVAALAMRDIGPLATAFWRWLVALAPLWTLLLASGQGQDVWKTFRRRPRTYLFLGLTGIVLLYACQNLALRYTTVFNTTFLINLTPIFIVLLAVFWLHERPRGFTLVGIGVGVGGAILLSGGSFADFRLSLSSLGGDALAAGAALAAAIYTVYGKRTTGAAVKVTPLTMLTLAVTVGVVGLLPLALYEGDFWPQQPLTWLCLLALGLGAGALGNTWWLHMLTTTPAAHAGVYLYATALVGSALAVLVLGEPLTVWIVIGGALILAGVWLVQRGQ